MTTKPSASAVAAKKKLLGRIAAAQRQTDVAKKSAKLAKLGFRQAKDKFKAARRAAKKLRKAVKTLKLELAALGKKPAPAPRKITVRKPAAKRVRRTPAAVPAPEPVAPAAVTEFPPAAPV